MYDKTLKETIQYNIMCSNKPTHSHQSYTPAVKYLQIKRCLYVYVRISYIYKLYILCNFIFTATDHKYKAVQTYIV